MSGRRLSEYRTVQRPVTRYASEVGWTFLTTDQANALRGDAADANLLVAPLRTALQRLNRGVVDKSNVDEVIARIMLCRPTIEGNEELLEWIRGHKTVYVPSARREMAVHLVDFNDAGGSNEYHVTQEWTVRNAQFANRADVVFCINGIPVVIFEAKSPRVRDAIDIGIEQIRRYHRETPEMMAPVQVFDVSHILGFWYGATWSLDRRSVFDWNDEQAGNFEAKVKTFFDQRRLLRVLRDYIAFIRRDDRLLKLLLRRHQIRGVEAVVRRVEDPEKTRGLIWHTQGAGKTLTMMTAAHILLTQPRFGKPTVLMLVDRNELEGQLFGNLVAYGFGNVAVADSKDELEGLLGSGFRGLIVSTIHKFDKMPNGINEDPSVVVLIDEAHRTTSGDFGNYLMAALPRATYIGFTGTPIDQTRHGRGTFVVFGKDDEAGYLDKYSIRESIEDGTTLPLHYSLAPNELLVPVEQLESEFLALAELEGVSDVEELNRVLDRAVNLRAFLKAPQRVKSVAELVAKHFKSTVQPLGYKAFLVGVDREACVLYKNALDKLLPPKWSHVVVTGKNDDSEEMKQHHLSEEREKQVRKDFIRPGYDPQILIVTEKLLTGFDAPILYCMYLDKPMRDHTLLQAIARVNRPFEEEGDIRKPAGFVLDFVGIFDKLSKALSFDSKEVSGVITDLDVLKAAFVQQMQKERISQWLALTAGTVSDVTVERIVDYFVDPDRRHAFTDEFKRLENLYEIISPDPDLGPFIEPFQQLAEIHVIVKNAYGVRSTPVSELARKTELLVREHIDIGQLRTVLPIYEIDAGTLAAVQTDSTSDAGRVVNLARSISEAGADPAKPYLHPIGERAREVLDEYSNRQQGTQAALRSLEEALESFTAAEAERKSLDMSFRCYTLFTVFRGAAFEDADALARASDRLVEERPDHKVNAHQARDLRTELYRLVLGKVAQSKLKSIVVDLLDALR